MGHQKYFVTATECLVSLTERLVTGAKFLVAKQQQQNVFSVVAVTNPFFFPFYHFLS